MINQQRVVVINLSDQNVLLIVLDVLVNQHI
jgi:hypothetical protein